MIYDIQTFNAECDGCEKVFSEESDYDNVDKLFADLKRDGWLLGEAKWLDPKPVYCPKCKKELTEQDFTDYETDRLLSDMRP